MPLVSSLLSTLANRNLDVTTNSSLSSLATNTTIVDGLPVICAWPVSGQYGVGTRVLYYALVAASVFARKADWLRGACLAGALIIPAVAALHGVSLAILHEDGAVDMDIYGAFQACCIGILAAPITVKLSKTYFNDPGRNTIFLWTLLIFAGLLSLTVEFYRVSPTPCNDPGPDGKPIRDASDFPYSEGSMCGLICYVNRTDKEAPYSPMRTSAVDNIYVIPAPDVLTPGTATLMAAGCCIPAILLLVSMWNTILETNWQSRFGRKEEELDIPIEGTNDATMRKMRLVNKRIGSFLALVEALLFGGAVLAVLILGEINFARPQVNYQTEPMASIGQWGPLVGALIAALGSLYVLMLNTDQATDKDESSSVRHCDCAHHHGSVQFLRDSADGRNVDPGIFESPIGYQTSFPPLETTTSPQTMEELPRKATLPTSGYSVRPFTSNEIRPSVSSERGRSPGPSPTGETKTERADAGGRLKIASTLAKLGEKLGTAERGLFDDSEFRAGQAATYPQIPGEEFKNPKLQETETLYQHTREVEEHERRSRSRAPSFVGSIASGVDDDVSPRMRSVSPGPSRSRPRRFTVGHATEGPSRSVSSPTMASSPGMPERRSTLEVPGHSRIHYGMRHQSSPTTGTLFISVPEVETGQESPSSPPAIVVSADPDGMDASESAVGSPITPTQNITPSNEPRP